MTQQHMFNSQEQSLTDFLNENEPSLPRVRLAAGMLLYAQNDPSDAMHVLISGKLGVRLRRSDSAEDIEIDQHSANALVGELGLMTGRPRTASIYALTDCELYAIDETAFRRIVDQHGDIFSDIDSGVRPRWQRLLLAEILAEKFGKLDYKLLHQLQSQLIWRQLRSGDTLIRAGESESSMFIVISGQLAYEQTEHATAMHQIQMIRRGETVGESALLTDGTRASTVIAVRDSDVVEMTREVFDAVSDDHPKLLRSIATNLLTRQRRLTAGKSAETPKPRDLSLVFMSTQPSVDVAATAKALATVLQQLGPTLLLDSAEFDARFGQLNAAQTSPDDPTYLAVTRWLGEQEAKHDFLIFVPDATWTAWTARCFGQSDRILLLADGNAEPAQSPMEQRAEELFPAMRRDLLLLHSAETDYPTNTVAHLAIRNISAHYHVRKGDRRTMGRMARRLVGRAISLCLSGGGARGYVHLGVFKALDELDIPIDMVVGTSFGALIGVLRARGLSTDAIMQLVRKYARNDSLFDRTLPLVALNRSQKVGQFCQDLYADAQAEDSWIPFVSVAANLTQASAQINTIGPVAQHIRKSISIPGVFAPVIEDGEMIVDGGVMNNFPVDLAIKFSESERVIGVHCAPRSVRKRHYDLVDQISGWQVLGKRINPASKAPKVPPIAATIMRTLDVNSLALARKNELLCDLLLQPEPTRYSLLDFEAYDNIMQLGYDESIAALRDWRDAQSDLIV